MKDYYHYLMEFIENTDNTEIGFYIKFFEKGKNSMNEIETFLVLQLLSKIAENHYRFPGFIDKLGQIIQYHIKQTNFHIYDFDIYEIFMYNKRILLLLFEQQIIKPDEQIMSSIMKIKDKNGYPYRHYLYSGIKSFIDENELKTIESEIEKNYNETIKTFEEKCRLGENCSYICSLIRQDSIEEFIRYTKKNSISLSSQIQPSIYETNSFLIGKNPTLIEYATFYGSIQIFQYLQINQVILTNSLWFYAIHSNNAELILFLEDRIKPLQKQIIEENFKESILCHHNPIADYIKNNYLYQNETDDFDQFIINSYNFYFYPSDICSKISRSSNGCQTILFYLLKLAYYIHEITIPSTVNSIGNFAFNSCPSLNKIIIPSSVKSIGNYAFYRCSSLKQISIPSSVTSSSYIIWEVFRNKGQPPLPR